MNSYDIYKNITERTNGDIYVGVVGPVRTGKSTFITKILNSLVLPNISDKNNLERTVDEMPQSGDGKSIMTTQPKFIPNEAVSVVVGSDINMKVRLVDCVGYLVDGAIGHIENEKPRLVKTPWSDEPMAFEKAAEVGTYKVISNHSSVGVLITTDGSITDIPRSNYVVAEEKVVADLKDCNKPFVMIVNSVHPSSPETINLAKELEKKYNVGVLALDVKNMSDEDVAKVFDKILDEFPVKNVCVKLPKWMQVLPFEHELIQEVYGEISKAINGLQKLGDFNMNFNLFENSVNFETGINKVITAGDGRVVFEVEAKPHLFYNILSEQCGYDIKNEYHLVSYIKQLAVAKQEYDHLKEALEQVKQTGYGVVTPTINDMKLEEPKIVKQGGKYGVKLKASAPSLHIMQVDIETEISPIVGTEQQSEEIVKGLLDEFANNPTGIWETKMFGRSLNSLVNDGLQSKLIGMPVNAQMKMRKTLGRIVNEGKGGVICILL